MARGLGLCPKGQGESQESWKQGSGRRDETLSLTPECQDPGRRAAASGVLVGSSKTCVHTRAPACTPTHTHRLPQHSFMHALLTHTQGLLARLGRHSHTNSLTHPLLISFCN